MQLSIVDHYMHRFERTFRHVFNVEQESLKSVTYTCTRANDEISGLQRGWLSPPLGRRDREAFFEKITPKLMKTLQVVSRRTESPSLLQRIDIVVESSV